MKAFHQQQLDRIMPSLTECVLRTNAVIRRRGRTLDATLKATQLTLHQTYMLDVIIGVVIVVKYLG